MRSRCRIIALRISLIVCSTLVAAMAIAADQSVVIPMPDYRPPETVQRVAVPIPPNSRKRLLILSGENSYEHDWTGVNNTLRRQLLETGRFDVRVTEDFSSATADTLKGYDVVLLNYVGRWNYTDKEEKRWGPVAEKALFDYVRNGGGAVVYHASFNMGSPSWPEFERFAGGTMRPFHGSRRSPPNGFMVHVVDLAHPVTRGMREYFWTLNDDMYTNMKWDETARVRVLAKAFDSADSYAPERAGPKYPPNLYTADKLARMKGMNAENPQVWTVEYGAGRVFCISLGHGPDTLQYDGVRGLIARGAEWAATGEVTIPVEEGARAFEPASH
jgi:type 1 glutamine amidotransferase